MKKRGPNPALFCCTVPICDRTAHRLIVAMARPVLENRMVPDQTSTACQLAAPIVIDDRRRLPGRFFGRFMTSATSGLPGAL
jgi:hypothetical protein